MRTKTTCSAPPIKWCRSCCHHTNNIANHMALVLLVLQMQSQVLQVHLQAQVLVPVLVLQFHSLQDSTLR